MHEVRALPLIRYINVPEPDEHREEADRWYSAGREPGAGRGQVRFTIYNGINVKHSDNNSLQVVPRFKNDPIRKLDEMTLDDWAEQEMQRLMQMSEDDILRELLGEDIQSAKAEPQPDGTICRTKDCNRHDNPLQNNKNNLNYVHDNSRAGSRSEKEWSSSSVQRGWEPRSHSEQGGDTEEKRKLGRRILVPESIERSVQEGLRAIGLEDSEAKKHLIYTTTAQLQAELDGRKPAFLEPFPELVELAYSDIASESNIRYVKASQHCIYNVDAVQKELNTDLTGRELDAFVAELIDNNKSGILLGYGYNFLDAPRGKHISITCAGEEISGFDGPINKEDAEHFARERLKDFVNTFPDLNWSYDIF